MSEFLKHSNSVCLDQYVLVKCNFSKNKLNQSINNFEMFSFYLKDSKQMIKLFVRKKNIKSDISKEIVLKQRLKTVKIWTYTTVWGQ